MTLQELLVEIGEEKAALVKEAIEAEQLKGIAKAKENNGKLSKATTELIRLKGIVENVGLDLDGDTDQQIEDLKTRLTAAAGKKKGEPDPEVAKLGKELASLKKLLADKDAEATEAKQKLTSAKLTERLTKALADKVVAHDYVIKDLIRNGQVKLGDNDSVVWLEGEDETDFDKGVEKFVKSNPALLKNTQKPGSGARDANAGGSHGDNSREIHPTEMLKMRHQR
jgi:hypothetical protein